MDPGKGMWFGPLASRDVGRFGRAGAGLELLVSKGRPPQGAGQTICFQWQGCAERVQAPAGQAACLEHGWRGPGLSFGKDRGKGISRVTDGHSLGSAVCLRAHTPLTWASRKSSSLGIVPLRPPLRKLSTKLPLQETRLQESSHWAGADGAAGGC